MTISKRGQNRVWLFYGQPYGGAPYGRFSDRSFFPILVSFLSFSDFKKKFKKKILRKKIQIFFWSSSKLNLDSRNFFQGKK